MNMRHVFFKVAELSDCVVWLYADDYVKDAVRWTACEFRKEYPDEFKLNIPVLPPIKARDWKHSDPLADQTVHVTKEDAKELYEEYKGNIAATHRPLEALQ